MTTREFADLKPGDWVLCPPSSPCGKQERRRLTRIERVSADYSFLVFDDGYRLGTHHCHAFEMARDLSVKDPAEAFIEATLAKHRVLH